MTNSPPPLKPMGLGLSTLYFGITSLLFSDSILGLIVSSSHRLKGPR